MTNWFRKWFPKKTMTAAPEVDPPLLMEPDPDMQPGQWQWACNEPGCGAEGTGEAQSMRVESFSHCLETGHVVYGKAIQ